MGFFSCHCVQTGSVTHPASYTMSTGSSHPVGKVVGGMKLTTELHLVLKLRMCVAISTIPQYISRCGARDMSSWHGVWSSTAITISIPLPHM
jgi:hypothetical protein